MATITVQTEAGRTVHQCGDRRPPVVRGNFFEFQDASEEELAFWNVLDDDEKLGVTRESYRRCFYDALHEFMRSEAEKGRKMEEEEAAAEQPKTGVPPNTPPSPSGPNSPPILEKED